MEALPGVEACSGYVPGALRNGGWAGEQKRLDRERVKHARHGQQVWKYIQMQTQYFVLPFPAPWVAVVKTPGIYVYQTASDYSRVNRLEDAHAAPISGNFCQVAAC